MNYTLQNELILKPSRINVSDCIHMSESYKDVLTYETWVAIGVIIFCIYFMVKLFLEIRKLD